MQHFLVAVALSVVVVPFCLFEGIRFHTLLQTCSEMHAQNAILLAGRDCNPWERRTFAKKDRMCAEAEQEQLVTPFWCACHRLWDDGEPRRLLHMFTRSPWMVWGITMPVMCFVVFMWFLSRTQRYKHDTMLKMQRQVMDQFAPLIQRSSPPASMALAPCSMEEEISKTPLKRLVPNHRRRRNASSLSSETDF